MPVDERDAVGAPVSTWDHRSGERREPDEVIWASLPSLVLLVACPLGALGGLVLSGLCRLFRVAWWWPLWVALAGMVAGGVVGWPDVWSSYAGVFGQVYVWVDDGVVPDLALVWSGMWVPSLVLAGLFGSARRLWAKLRRPVYRPEPVRRSARRLEKLREQLRRGVDAADGGVVFGVDSTHELVGLSPRELSLHGLIVGGTGTGKTTLMLELLRGFTSGAGTGGGLVYIDLKGSPGLVEELRLRAAAAGRGFHLWTMEGDRVWNPLARGNATELRDKLVLACGPYESEFYLETAKRYLQTLFNALCHPLVGPDEITLSLVESLLTPARLRDYVLGTSRQHPALGPHDPLRAEVVALVEDYKEKYHRDGLAGWATRLHTRTRAVAGVWLDGTDGIDLFRSMVDGDVVLFSLDSSRYQDAAGAIAKAIIRELVTVMAEMQQLEFDGPIGGTVVCDEFSAVGGDDLLSLFARGREAGVGCWLLTQTLADLERGGEVFASQVVANTPTKVVFRLDEPKDVERVAAMFGTERMWDESVGVDTRSGLVAEPRGGATGDGRIALVDKLRVHPNTVKQLPTGECVLIGKNPWRLHVVSVVPRERNAAWNVPAAKRSVYREEV